MSRAYRLQIPLALLDVEPGQGVHVDIDLLPILEGRRMAELLVEAWRRRGAVERDGRWVIERPSGVELRLDPDARRLEIVVGGEAQTTVEAWIEEENLDPEQVERAEAGELELTAQQLEALGGYFEGMGQRHSAEVQRLLLRETRDARLELNRALKETYRDAVLEKARSLGQVTSTTESEHDGEYRIRIELDA